MLINIIFSRLYFLLLLAFFINTALADNKNSSDDLDFVLVGDANNAADPVSGCGKVTYPFEISTYEVTNTHYTEFLNSVARYNDKYELYSPMSEQHYHGGLIRSQKDNIYSYTIKAGYGNFPVTFVSWYDAVRYINWLHFGKPNSGYATLGTTEGTAVIGAYNTRDFPDTAKSNSSANRRNKNAVFWLPSCDEWVKAGFYDSASPSQYYQYATMSNAAPKSNNPENSTKGANYYDGKWAVPFPHLTEVGAYKQSPSPYGTFDQAGNVMEWVENSDGLSRRALGGSVFMYNFSLKRDYRDGELPHQKLSTFGFRVAKAPATKARPYEIDPHQKLPGKLENILPTKEHSYTKKTYVHIGNVDNKADAHMDRKNPVLGLGHVHYEFEISKYSITNEEYADFLNHVATKSDPYQLYHPDMGTGVLGGIARTTKDNKFSYAVINGYDKKPATYISWYMAARLANYYHYGQPNTGQSAIGTTEGTNTEGAYDTRYFPTSDNPTSVNYKLLPETRNIGARYWIPTNDEWYKAVYYDPSKFGRNYWNYPTKSDDPPNNMPPPGNGNSANYSRGTLAEGPPFYLTDVDAYPTSKSYYAVTGAGGQVWEWLEDWRNKGGDDCWRCNEWVKGLRGGSFGYSFRGLSGANIDPGDPSHSYAVYGIRLARGVDEKGWKPVAAQIYWGERLNSFVGRAIFDAAARPFFILGGILAILLSLFLALLSWRLYVKIKQ